LKLKSFAVGCCAAAILLVGCSSPKEQIRSAVSGCMGALDAPGITVAPETGNIVLAIWSKGATVDDAECVLRRLGAPSRVLTKVASLTDGEDTGYTEWGAFRVEVFPGPLVKLIEAGR
jgi:hypothetical protein